MKDYFIIAIIIVWGSVFSVQGQSTQSVAGLFESEDLLEIQMEVNLGKLLKDRGEDPKYHNATISVKLPDGSDHIEEAEVQVRGNFRRQPGNCNFPPLRVKFSKKNPPNGIFTGQRKLKLVTHCQTQDLILREYMAYKVYNLFTEVSFRVRLVQINYIDTKDKRKPETSYAFFIEDDDAVAERIGGEEVVEELRLQPEALQRDLLTQLYIFQCMIGNTDWDITLEKNMKFINFGEDSPIVAVPYDFDWSEIVDAPYTNVGDMERQVFRQLCRTDEEIEAALAVFHEKKEAIFDLYKSNPHVKGKGRNVALSTFKKFYKRIKNPEEVKKYFQESCQ